MYCGGEYLKVYIFFIQPHIKSFFWNGCNFLYLRVFDYKCCFFYLEVSLLLTFLVACVNMVVVDSRFKKNVQFIIESLFIF